MKWMKDKEESKFKYLWRAVFKNKVILQDSKDRYSKYDPNAEHNPSSFRDFLDYFNSTINQLKTFELWGDKGIVVVDFSKKDGRPEIRFIERDRDGGGDKERVLLRSPMILTDQRPIYYRKMEAQVSNGEVVETTVKCYVVGFQGRDAMGNNQQKTVTVI